MRIREDSKELTRVPLLTRASFIVVAALMIFLSA